jgi:predicted nucleic acid-binding protein
LREAVLADTGPLYAAADPNDSFHARSLEEQERLEVEDIETAVSYATVQEAYILVLRKFGIAQARSFL